MKPLNRIISLTLLAGLGFGLTTQVNAMTAALPSLLDSSTETILQNVGLESKGIDNLLSATALDIVNPPIGEGIVVGIKTPRGISPTRPPPKGPPVARHPRPRPVSGTGGGSGATGGGSRATGGGGTGRVEIGPMGTPIARPTPEPGPRMREHLGLPGRATSSGSPVSSASRSPASPSSGSAVSLSPPKEPNRGNLLAVPSPSTPPPKKASWPEPRKGGGRNN